MKKHLLWGAAVALVFSLSSCDEVIEVAQTGLLGSAEITITGENGFFTNDTTIEFSSTVVDVFDTTVTYHDKDTVYNATLDLFANIDLQKSELTFPFMGYQVSDTVPGTYTLSHVLTKERLRNFNFDSIADIVLNPSGFNVLLIAIDTNTWYVSDGGVIEIKQFPGYGGKVKGEFKNVNAFYFTKDDIERLDGHLDDPDLNLNDYFHPAVINGEFNSKRAFFIHKLIDEFNRQRAEWEHENQE